MISVMIMSFSKKLADAMKEKEISTRKLSELTGIPKSAIQRYTSGETEKIPIDRMILMAEAIGINPAYIMGWDSKVVAEKLEHIRGITNPTAKKLQSLGKALDIYVPKDEKENELIAIYRRLNNSGRGILINTARGLAANPNMKKEN